METTYALLDNDGVILNIIVAKKDDTEVLEKIKETSKASSYREIDLELIIGKVGLVYWNGVHWDRVIQ